MPQVSVIIPSFNNAETLPAAIESVFKQADIHLEVVVVDDGSEDNTQQVMRAYQDKVTFIRQSNQGPGGARNTGMQEARGDFICFLDADDVLLDNSIKARLDVFANHPEVALVFGEFDKVNSDGTMIPSFLATQCFLSKFAPSIAFEDEQRVVFNDQYTDCAVRYFPYIWTSSVMIRADVVKQVGDFQAYWRGSEDIDYWLRVAEVGKLAFVKQSVSIWNHHQSTMTKLGNIDFYRDTISCYEHIKQKIKAKKYLKKAINQRLSHYAFAGGYEALACQQLKTSRKFFLKSCRYRLSLKSSLYAIISLMPPKMFYGLREWKQKVGG